MEKQNRLKSNKEFKKVYDRGKSFANKYLVIFFIKNGMDYNRVGFVTTKKLGNAVKRNLYRRRLKEVYRLNSENLKPGYDIILLFRSRIPEIGYKEIESAFNHITSIAGLTHTKRKTR